MYITKDDFEKIEFAIDLLISEIKDYHLQDLHAGTKQRCYDAYCVLQNLKKKRVKDTKRQIEYINWKRKTDPKYFRSRKRLEQAVRDIVSTDMEIVLFNDQDDIEEALKTATDNDLIEFIKSYE